VSRKECPSLYLPQGGGVQGEESEVVMMEVLGSGSEDARLKKTPSARIEGLVDKGLEIKSLTSTEHMPLGSTAKEISAGNRDLKEMELGCDMAGEECACQGAKEEIQAGIEHAPLSSNGKVLSGMGCVDSGKKNDLQGIEEV
jgi:hypothetical protein